jgi:hypothetical protein
MDAKKISIIIIIVLSLVLCLMGYFLLNSTSNDTVDLYKKQYEKSIAERDAKFQSDSIAYFKKGEEIKIRTKSIIDSANSEHKHQQQIIISYDNQIKHLTNLPPVTIDRKYDSTIAYLRRRYN